MYIIKCGRCRAEFKIEFNGVSIKVASCSCGETENLLIAQKAPVAEVPCGDGLGRQFLTADNKVISLGMKIYVRDPDKFEFEDDYILEQTVEAMYLEKGFSEYKGDITIGGEDWEGGNLDCYAAKDNVSA